MDVVPDDRTQAARRAVDRDIKCCRSCVRVADRRGRELFANRVEGEGEIVRDRRGSAQALNGIPSLPDRERALLEGSLQLLFGFQRSIRKDVRGGLKAK